MTTLFKSVKGLDTLMSDLVASQRSLEDFADDFTSNIFGELNERNRFIAKRNKEKKVVTKKLTRGEPAFEKIEVNERSSLIFKLKICAESIRNKHKVRTKWIELKHDRITARIFLPFKILSGSDFKCSVRANGNTKNMILSFNPQGNARGDEELISTIRNGLLRVPSNKSEKRRLYDKEDKTIEAQGNVRR